MKHYLFKVTLSGYGDSLQSAWDDATEQFAQDPGAPDDEGYTVEDEDDAPQLPESISKDGTIAV